MNEYRNISYVIDDVRVSRTETSDRIIEIKYVIKCKDVMLINLEENIQHFVQSDVENV